ncbi:hypothetical protein MSAN_02014800 [Mycena sanguinolenta]|uniref:Uncharacterized protein n=1 Tax=Mycena sanguinolenta TaxID=230812 RepID=A0A8H7CNJ9_9AGAR|nr:hypothetical protein MSAN_02014800 [Mycena sanguinolenta]
MAPASQRYTYRPSSPTTTVSRFASPSKLPPSKMFSPAMFSVALLALSGAVAAVSDLQVPSKVTSGGRITITWSSDASDTTPFTVMMFSSAPTFIGPFAIANDVNPQDNKLEIELPQLMEGDTCTIGLSSVNDPGKILVSSGEFSVGAPTYGTTTTKVLSSHVPVSTQSAKPASASHVSGSASHSGSGSVTHSASSVPIATSLSVVASLTVPFPSASAMSHPILSFTSQVPSMSAMTSGTHAPTAPSASAGAHTGGALAIRVPALGLAVIMGGLLIGALGV